MGWAYASLSSCPWEQSARQKVESAWSAHLQDFVTAKALQSDLMVEEIFAVPTREVNLLDNITDSSASAQNVISFTVSA